MSLVWQEPHLVDSKQAVTIYAIADVWSEGIGQWMINSYTLLKYPLGRLKFLVEKFLANE